MDPLQLENYSRGPDLSMVYEEMAAGRLNAAAIEAMDLSVDEDLIEMYVRSRLQRTGELVVPGVAALITYGPKAYDLMSYLGIHSTRQRPMPWFLDRSRYEYTRRDAESTRHTGRMAAARLIGLE